MVITLWVEATDGKPHLCQIRKHRGSGDIMVLDGHVVSQDHVTKGSSNISKSISRLVIIRLSLVLA